ncbi:MAG: cation-translocating P-type ATPase [Desulfobacteraceae bacterium]|nr:MAG: cation-translocating P-type ATPase [Desulfobacteraceae bacterium]
MRWHEISPEEVAPRLQSSLEGLTSADSRERLEQFGFNELVEQGKRSPFLMFLDQFKDFMILILIGAAFVAGIIGEPSDSIAIAVIVILNAVLGFVQEYRAEKAMAALKKMAAPSTSVLRDGNVEIIGSEFLVPGDLVLLEAGNVVPADVRLTESFNLKADESALTGESVPVEKTIETIKGKHLSLGERKNMVYKGTQITYGRGRGHVVATGMATELGKIAAMLQTRDDSKTPLQKRLASFGQKLAYAVLAICLIVFIAGLFRGEPPLLMLLTAISLAVAAIPEALPAVITISLALGARKLVRKNALIRKLPAVETLGSVTYICTDKTGTLTMNKMTVEEIYIEGRMISSREMPAADPDVPWESGYPVKGVEVFLAALCLSNDARLDGSGTMLGDPTETALLALAMEKGFTKDKLDKLFPRLSEIPFDSERKLMTTFHSWGSDRVISFTKGAVEEILRRCDAAMGVDEKQALDEHAVLSLSEAIAAKGMRALGFGMRVWEGMPEHIAPGDVENGLVFLGFVGMVDPPRPEARGAVSMCISAGIRPVMITGDHPVTAREVARRTGIIEDDEDGVITGHELEEMPFKDFEARVESIGVYARVAPEQKLKIVEMLQSKGHFVAMTGDGVNDAPALKRADIGVAMGRTGTDVAKEASHMILLDDNFVTIVNTIREGRRIFDNIRKFIKYTMTSNSGEIWTIFLAPFLGLPVPLLPIHILWINLVTDGVPGLALAAEPAEKDIMKRPPRHPAESIFAHGLGAHIIWVGLLMGAVSIVTQAAFIHSDQGRWQTMVFTVLCLSQMGNLLAIRSEKESFFRQGPLSNKPMLLAIMLTFGLQMAVIYIPFLNPIFKTQPLSAFDLLLAIVLSSFVFLAAEIEKMIRRRTL